MRTLVVNARGLAAAMALAAIGCAQTAPDAQSVLGFTPTTVRSTAPDTFSPADKPVDFDGSGLWSGTGTVIVPYPGSGPIELQLTQDHKGDLTNVHSCGTSTCTLEFKRQRPGTTIAYKVTLKAAGGDRACIDMQGRAEINTATNTLTGSFSGQNYWAQGPTGCLYEEDIVTLQKQ
ncbi:MAG: hypothetical protein FJW14_03050 [Acidimicrobiia bacterium]|nr:hypothetical protein [Acidimicrobiia bacterium]